MLKTLQKFFISPCPVHKLIRITHFLSHFLYSRKWEWNAIFKTVKKKKLLNLFYLVLILWKVQSKFLIQKNYSRTLTTFKITKSCSLTQLWEKPPHLVSNNMRSSAYEGIIHSWSLILISKITLEALILYYYVWTGNKE